MCIFKDCLTTQNNSYFPPSQNIYVSEPDYKGYYKVFCRLNCGLSFHKQCWVDLKTENIDKLKLTKIPSEKDFFGQPCFTPDCDGVIIKIEINDEFGEVTSLQDAKLIEKLDEEEKRQKEEARLKRDKEEEEKRIRKLEEKLKKNKNRDKGKKQIEESKVKQTGEKSSPIPTTAPETATAGDKSAAKTTANPNTAEVAAYRKETTDRDEGGNRNKLKKNKNKDKRPENTLHWEEFRGTASAQPDSDYQERLRRLEAIRESHETRNFLLNPPPPQPQPPLPAPVVVEEKPPVAKVATTAGKVEYCEEEVVKESICSYVHDILKTHGPLRLDNPLLWKDLGEANVRRLIFRDGGDLKRFLLSNSDRFAIVENTVCIKEKQKLFNNPEDWCHSGSSSPGSGVPRNIFGNFIRDPASPGAHHHNAYNNSTITIKEDGLFKETNASGNFSYESASGGGGGNGNKRDSFSYDGSQSLDGSQSSIASLETACRAAAAMKPNLGEVARRMREQLLGLNQGGEVDNPRPDQQQQQLDNTPATQSRYGHDTDMEGNQVADGSSLGLANEAGKSSILEMIQKNAREARLGHGVNQQQANSVPATISQASQTTVSALDEDMDEMAVREMNASLTTINGDLTVELQEAKDKLYKIQAERKLELKELSDKNQVLADENKKLRTDSSALKDQVSKMKRLANDAVKLEQDKKEAEKNLAITVAKYEELQDEKMLTETKLGQEQSLSFQQQNQLVQLRQDKMAAEAGTVQLRQKVLLSQFQRYQDLISTRERDNQAVIAYLRQSDLVQAPGVQRALSQLDEYTARLILASEEVKTSYEALVRLSSEASSGHHHGLHHDLLLPEMGARLEPPNLGQPLLNALHGLLAFQRAAPPSGAPSGPQSFSAAPGPIGSRPSPSSSPAHHHRGATSSSPSSTSPRAALGAETSTATRASPVPAPPGMGPPRSRPGLGHHLGTGFAPGPPPPGLSAMLGTAGTGRGGGAPPQQQRPPGHNPMGPIGGPVSRPQDPIGRPPPPTSSSAAASVSVPVTRPIAMPPQQDPIGTKPKTVAGGATAAGGRTKSYDKLVAQLQKEHPDLSKADAQTYILELRGQNPAGKLSGMSIQDIIKKVGTFIERDRSNRVAAAQDNNCSICFEEMSPTDSRYLNPCLHRFHNECINKWLDSPGGAGSTYPMCRNYIVKEEEFPGLGSGPPGARRF